jgi:hypothetical protein
MIGSAAELNANGYKSHGLDDDVDSAQEQPRVIAKNMAMELWHAIGGLILQMSRGNVELSPKKKIEILELVDRFEELVKEAGGLQSLPLLAEYNNSLTNLVKTTKIIIELYTTEFNNDDSSNHPTI